MKRIVSVFILLLLCLSLCACGSKEAPGKEPAASEESSSQTESAEAAAEEKPAQEQAGEPAETPDDQGAEAADEKLTAEEAADLLGDRYYRQDSTLDFLAGAEAAMAEYKGLWDYCDYGSYELTYRLTMYEDGSFTFCLDRDAMHELADQVISDTRGFVYAYLSDTVTSTYKNQGIALEDVYKELGLETFEELLAWLRYDPAAMTDKIISRDSFDTVATASVINGTYTVNSTELTLTCSGGSTVQTYSLDGDTLVLYGPAEGEGDILRLQDSYPVVFHR